MYYKQVNKPGKVMLDIESVTHISAFHNWIDLDDNLKSFVGCFNKDAHVWFRHIIMLGPVCITAKYISIVLTLGFRKPTAGLQSWYIDKYILCN